MGLWQVGPDALARSRFVISELAETVAALSVLAGADAGPAARPWAAEHRPVFRARLAADPFAARFVEAALRPKWLADFITVPPERTDRSFEDEIRRVRETPAEVVLSDLAVALGAEVPSVLVVPEAAGRAAALLEWVWTETVRPDWTRRRRILEADIVARTHRLASAGWAGALEGMRPGLRWLGDGRLQINAHDNPPRDIADAELLFMPITPRRGWVGWDRPHRYAVVYPCSGILTGASAVTPPPEALARLLGRARATVLVHLETPRSTTQLVALTGFGLGTVGGHLKVLRDAGLVRRRRAGRSVLYERTSAGRQLVRPQPEG